MIEYSTKDSGLVIGKVIYDEDQIPEMYDPREYENICTMFCGHRDYILGDVQLQRGEDVRSTIIEHFNLEMKCESCGKEIIQEDWHMYYHAEDADMDDFGEDQYKCGGDNIAPSLDDLYIMPLYLYDHSGISISTSGFRHVDSAGWDWGTVGAIAVPHKDMEEDLKSEWRKTTHVDKTDDEFVEWLMRNEVNTYDLYLTGQCFGYVVEDKATGEEMDSCWGFLGTDSVEEELNGAMEACHKEIAQKNELIDQEETAALLPINMVV